MVPCTITIRAGKRTYQVHGEMPSDAPTVAERQAAGAAALATLVAARGVGYGYTDAEPEWTTAVCTGITWPKSANL